MKITIVVTSNDAETVWNAFRLATTCLAYDNDVSVFLLGKGVEAPTLGTLQYNIAEQMALYRESGGRLVGCGVCCETRRTAMPLLEQQLGSELGSMQQLYGLIADADRVLTF